jgi:hypothetical protein
LNLGNRHSEKIKTSDNYITDFKADTWDAGAHTTCCFFKKVECVSVEVQGIEFSQNGMLSSEGHLYLDQIEILPAAFIAICVR